MKKIIRLLVLSFVLSVLLVNTVFGNNWENIPGNHGESILLDQSIRSSIDKTNRYGRGEILAEGAAEIANKQNGEIYIGMYTLAHRDVDFIQHTYFLDQWDESRQDWVQVDYMSFTRTKEEEADGTLSYLMTSDTISGYPVNRYYRVRGIHLVELNGETEMCSTQTNGVLITKN